MSVIGSGAAAAAAADRGSARSTAGSARLAGWIAELDGLRALAALAVLVSHFGLFAGLPALDRVGFLVGSVGVDLFFVLSGFLITALLLAGRDTVEAGTLPRRLVLRNFYARRFLRIFPLYYLTIAVLFALGFPAIREHVVAFLTYTMNIASGLSGSHFRPLGHFWTLCVEEQFYLVWPLLVLAAGRRRLLPLLAGAALLAVGWRIGVWRIAPDAPALRTFTLSCLDLLGAGAALAVLWQRPRALRAYRRVAGRLAGLGAAGLLALLVRPAVSFPAYWTFAPVFECVLFTWLVDVAASGRARGWLGSGLRFAPLVAMGRISYGVYVVHPLAGKAAHDAVASVAPWVTGHPVSAFAVQTAATLAVASFSWFAIERPLLRFKRHFPAAPRAAEAGPSGGASHPAQAPTAARA